MPIDLLTPRFFLKDHAISSLEQKVRTRRKQYVARIISNDETIRIVALPVKVLVSGSYHIVIGNCSGTRID